MHTHALTQVLDLDIKWNDDVIVQVERVPLPRLVYMTSSGLE